MTKNILVLAGDFVEDYEIMVPFQSLLLLGFQVHVVCPDKKSGDKVKTAIHDFEGDQTYTEKPGHNFQLNYTFDEVKPENYHGLVLPGGRAPEYLRLNEKVLQVTKHFVDAKKPILSICHGIQILTALKGSITGHNVTAYYACQTEVELAGGKYQSVAADQAVTDHNIVSTPAWPGHQESIKAFAALLGVKITHS
ncbi:hypothetical protein ABPG72_009266 [Tetrahymena utriculariae]